jgi:signal peptidase I
MKENMSIWQKVATVLANKYVRFGIVLFCYLLWVVWVGSWWLILLIPLIYDAYISKKINWSVAFWKKKGSTKNKIVEWIDSLLFAVIAVTLINIFTFQMYKIPTGSMEKTLQIGDHLFVSKLKYGPKIPNTPLSFPFAQHTMPLTVNTKSYLEWIKIPYKRLKGFTNVKNDDIVVFNFPEGDTVIVRDQASSYYLIVRRYAESLRDRDKIINTVDVYPIEHYITMARNQIHAHNEITVRPVDRRDNYVKRCVAVAGDMLQIIEGQVYINGQKRDNLPLLQFRYLIQTDGSRINVRTLERMGIYRSDLTDLGGGTFEMPMTVANAEEFAKMENIQSIKKQLMPQNHYDRDVFPHDHRYSWNLDNMGPIWIPKKGVTVDIDTANISFYQRIISAYEGNTLNIKDGEIFINDIKSTTYTFQMDYYWMMGDNRHDSLDSRFWGFVPEDHVVGAPRFVWLSLNKEKSFPANIRFKKMFRSAGQ